MLKNNYVRNKILYGNLFWKSMQVFSKQGITFLTFFICASLLNPFEFGIYNYVIAFVFMFITFGDFGISTATSKYVAELRVKDEQKLKGVLFNVLLISLVFNIIIVIVALFIGKYFFKENLLYFYLVLPLVFLISTTSLLDGIYSGFERFKESSLKFTSVGLISIVIVIVLTIKYKLLGAFIALDIHYLLLVLILLVGFKDIEFKYNRKLQKEILKYSVVIGLGSVGFYFYTKVDILFLGHYNFMEEIGYYEIVNKLLALILTPLLVIAQVIAPKITQLFVNGKYNEINRKLKHYFLFSFGFGLFTIASIYFSKGTFLNFFLPDYNSAEMHNILSLMLFVFFTQILTGIIPTGFTVATGHAKWSMYILIFFGILNVVLDYFLINSFGFIGIIYATIICKISADIIFLSVYFRIIHKLKPG